MLKELPTAYEIAENERKKQLENNANLPFGMESDDPDGFYPLEMGDCTAKLMPGPEFNSKLYRGQSELYKPCRPSLYRGGISRIDRIIDEMRFLSFKENIKNLPNVTQFSSARILSYRLFVDYLGIAQHYGLKTPLLDFSSDPFVAAFFATTYYDNKEGRYFPIEDESRKGVFYCFDLTISGGFSPSQADILGAQPFLRPVNQKAFSVKLSEKGCLHENESVLYQEFRHNKEAAQKIYDRFEGGDTLIPNDPVADMADNVALQNTFSEKILSEALESLDIKEELSFIKDELSPAGVRIVKEPTNYLFTEEGINIINKTWEKIKVEIGGKVYIRPVLRPD